MNKPSVLVLLERKGERDKRGRGVYVYGRSVALIGGLFFNVNFQSLAPIVFYL